MPIFGGGKPENAVNAMPGMRTREDAAQPALLTATTEMRKIGQKEVDKALETLRKYKSGKENLEKRIVEDEQWFKLRHQEFVRKQKRDPNDPEPTSAWLFNSVTNKHADAMDNYPEANVLPREQGDAEDAKKLSCILPVILERDDFEGTYSDNWYKKLKDGSAAYGVFWDKDAENGLGDISISALDLLSLFWEPGQRDIQKSRSLFLVSLVDKDLLEAEYPNLKGKLDDGTLDVSKYSYEDNVDTTDKALVVDWYYKVKAANGRTLLHYAKIAGGTLLFASENDQRYTEQGFYDHGKYPVVLDNLYPEEGSPVGFGLIAVAKDPQLYIDKLSGNLLKSTMMATTPRYFMSKNCGINKEQFKDWSQPIIDVEGSLDENRVRNVEVGSISGAALNIYQMKIDELKETTSNRDVGQGSTGGGVTAAAAIAALQEAGNKGSRDMIAASYRAYTKIGYLCLELIRQFYDEERAFCITGESGKAEFISYSNATIKDQPMAREYEGQELEPDYVPGFRRPVFDIKIRAAKRSPFSRMSQNQLATELYGAGFFDPQRAEQALGALDMMEFEGKDKVVERVKQGHGLLQLLQQQSQRMAQMEAMLMQLSGQGERRPDGGAAPAEMPHGGTTPTPKLQNPEREGAKTAMTGYGESLAARAVPSMDRGSQG